LDNDDPERALEIVQDQRNRGYTAWIEDEHGLGVDEESLKIGKAEPTKPTLYERVTGNRSLPVAFGTQDSVGHRLAFLN
jgi:hypothetical protein